HVEPLASAAMLGGRRGEHAAVRLDDGSVLVVGGRGATAAEVRGDAFVYRHDLTGPWSSVAVQTFGGDGAPLVVPGDPSRASIAPGDGTHPDRLVLVGQPQDG